MIEVRGYAAQSAESLIAPFSFERRDPSPRDVQIDILYCGVCHSDLHQTRNDWGGSIYPMVPGHEIVGRVVAVGSEVKKLGVGDFAGVGCLVDSCRNCSACDDGLENYCENGMTPTYNGKERKSQAPTYGGYSEQIVVDKRYVVKIPATMDLKAVAPLLCAGITTYSPLRHWKIGSEHKVGIIGLGGLGHMGVKFAKAFGAAVTMITTSPEKGKDARRLGADAVLISHDQAAMAEAKNSFDFLLNTVPVGHDLNPYAELLKRDATMVLVGALTALEPGLLGYHLMAGRKSIAGSGIGGLPETQEMINFCADNDIVSDVEMISMQDINEAYQRLLQNDVKYRFVIDMSSLKT
jgi:uncharacterized zinc-type alcohol dehydrogenase-like protein